MRIAKGSTISGDAGHNCYPDIGAKGIRSEDSCTKAVWKLVINKLESVGYETVDCTPWDKTLNSAGASKGYRVKLANGSNSSLHLSIHFNEGGGRGVECWVSKLGGRSEKFAYQICTEISKLGFVNRGVKHSNIYVTEYTKMPSVLIECCFIDSKEDMDNYDPDKIASAIVMAITGQQDTLKQ
jgi:N-acetylmuramoyl-L-alanine amidase